MAKKKTNDDLIDEIADAAGELARRAGKEMKRALEKGARATGRAIKRGANAAADYIEENVTAEKVKAAVREKITTKEKNIKNLDKKRKSKKKYFPKTQNAAIAVARGYNVSTKAMWNFILAVGLDNKIIDGLQWAWQKSDKPVRNAYLTWYFTLIMAMGGATFGTAKGITAAKEKIEDIRGGGKDSSDSNEQDENPVPSVIQSSETLNPTSADFINQCIAHENITSIPIIYTETYRAIPKVQRFENVWTYGFGMTWILDKHGRLTLRAYADTKANRRNGYTPRKPKESRTMDYDLDVTQVFLRDNIYPSIKKHMKREITANEFYAICVAGYQKPGHIDDICRKLNKAKTPQEIANAFYISKQNSGDYTGTIKRRWVCGMLAAGYITMNDILNADIDAFYAPADLNTFIRNGRFVCDANTINYIMNIRQTKTTLSVVSKLKDGKAALAQLEHGVGRVDTRLVAENTSQEEKQISESMGTLLKATKEYRAGNLSSAAEMYELAIKQDPNNMQAYSDLALVYKKLGDKSHSLGDYEKSLDVVVKCNKQMNANKSLLLDYGVKASSYYNAALARVEMAKIFAAQNNQTQAQRNYKLAIKNLENAIYNCEQGELDDENIQIYQQEINRIRAKLNKVTSFNAGKSKVQQKSENRFLADLAKYNKKSNG